MSVCAMLSKNVKCVQNLKMSKYLLEHVLLVGDSFFDISKKFDFFKKNLNIACINIFMMGL